MNERTNFGFDTTTDEVLEGLDLTGRRALITGGSGGLGAETARALASKGARVVFTARNLDKAETVARAIREETKSDVSVVPLELGSLSAVRENAASILDKHDAFDLLINNAAIMACPHGETADGFERQFGTNHLGHFLFTSLMMPALRRGDRARIVNVSSRAHFISPVHLDDLHFGNRAYHKWGAYGQSKTANVLFTVELERRFGPEGIHSFALHPGVIATDLTRHLEDDDHAMLEKRVKSGVMTRKSIPAGAATQVYAATAPELEGRGGAYLENCAIAAVDDESPSAGVRSYAVDKDVARALFALSEELVGAAF